MTGQDYVELLQEYLFDPDGDVWFNPLALKIINEAIQVVAMLRRDSTAKTITYTVTADSDVQELPDDGELLQFVHSNVVSGKPIRKIAKESLIELGVDWNPQSVTDIEHYLYDPENPKVFWVWPVPDSALQIKLTYSARPAKIGLQDTPILSDSYQDPIIEHALYRALNIETDRKNTTKSFHHLQACYNALGVKLQNENVFKNVQRER
jgi:hypothetical protein